MILSLRSPTFSAMAAIILETINRDDHWKYFSAIAQIAALLVAVFLYRYFLSAVYFFRRQCRALQCLSKEVS